MLLSFPVFTISLFQGVGISMVFFGTVRSSLVGFYMQKLQRAEVASFGSLSYSELDF